MWFEGLDQSSPNSLKQLTLVLTYADVIVGEAALGDERLNFVAISHSASVSAVPGSPACAVHMRPEVGPVVLLRRVWRRRSGSRMCAPGAGAARMRVGGVAVGLERRARSCSS